MGVAPYSGARPGGPRPSGEALEGNLVHVEAPMINRRAFLTTSAVAAAGLAFPAIVRAQSKDSIKIGFPLPLTGTFAAIAADMQRGAQLAWDEVNAKGGIMGRKLEVLFRDDQLKPAVG